MSNRLMEEVEECIDEDSEDDFEKEMLRELDESLQVKANPSKLSCIPTSYKGSVYIQL